MFMISTYKARFKYPLNSRCFVDVLSHQDLACGHFLTFLMSAQSTNMLLLFKYVTRDQPN